MITLKKEPGKDFMILNLTDTQLSDEEWGEGHINRKIFVHTVNELVNKVRPDLITVSGDLAWAGHKVAYKALGDFLDSFGIPWAPVWGNHDNQDGPEFIDYVVEEYKKYKYFLYEKGDAVLGNGNYVIGIEENGKIVEGIIMMDSHDSAPYTEADGSISYSWAKLIPEQIEWYRDQVQDLSAKGCNDTVMILHIPIYAYRQALNAALRDDVSIESMQKAPEMYLNGECWKEEYKDTVGVIFEEVGCYKADDGVLEVLKELKSTKHIIAGHDHVNNYMIDYQDIRLITGLKTGPGCYWNPRLNGGTVVRVTSDGVADVYHEYVDVCGV